MTGRLALTRELCRIKRMIAQGDEGNAFREHQRNQKVVTAREFANHDEGAHGHMRDSAIKRAHADEGKRAGINARIAGQKPRDSAECASYEAPDCERRRDAAAAGSLYFVSP